MIPKHALIISLAVLVFLSGCLETPDNGTTINGTPDDTVWPDFSSYKKSTIKPVYEDGKPLVLVFSTTWCPHCTWIKESYDEVLKEYVAEGKIVARHWDLDVGDNTLTDEVETAALDADTAVFQSFNDKGTIPTFVIAQKYYRIGTGYEQSGSYKGLEGLEAEQQELRDILDELLNSS
jgi:thiol-disulfide isomerase/thioredoxin